MNKDSIQYRILIIEDNAGDAVLIEEYLHEQIQLPLLQFAGTLREAKRMLASNEFDIVLLDLTLPDNSGKELIETILQQTNISCPVIVLTGYADVTFSKSTISLGVSDYLLKDDLNAVILYKSIIYAIERHRTILRLEESEKKYSDLFNLSPQPMYVYDIETLKFVQANVAAIAGYGYTEEEFSKMTLPDLSKTKDPQKLMRDIQTLGEHSTYSGIVTHKKKSGEQIDVEIYTTFVMFNNRRCRSAIAIDITERKNAERALQQSEARLKSILESQSSYAIRTDLDGNYTYYNHNFFDQFQWLYGKDDLIGCNGLHSIMAYDHEKVGQTVMQCMANPNTIFQIEIDKPGKSGQVRTTLWDFVCLTDEHGKPAEIQCVGIDTTEWKKAERQFLKTLEERNTILESIGDAFFAVDKTWVVTYWNNEAEAEVAIPRSSIVGKPLLSVFPQLEGSPFLQYLQNAESHNGSERLEVLMERPGRWWEVTAYPSDNGLSVYCKDITARKQSEEEIKNNERKLQVLFDTVSEIIYMVSVEDGDRFRFVSMNAAGLNAMGITEEQVIGRYVQDVIPNPSWQLVLSNYKTAIEQKRSVAWVETTPYPTGIKTAKVAASPVFNDEGKCILLVGSVFDITEQLAYEEKLKASNAELRQLASHLQHVREEERLNMAREIHDELGQQLTGIKMDISWLNRKLKTEDRSIKSKLEESISLIDTTIGTVRKIAADLRPSVLDDLGLADAINWLSHEFTKRSGIMVRCNTNVDHHKFDPKVSIAAFRIYQESLTNISRHANATEVDCDLQLEEGMLRLMVSDNGSGFNLQQQSTKQTLGLLGMKERVTELNGTYNIESSPGRGTIVLVKIPLLRKE